MLIGINTLFLVPGKVGGTETYVRGLLAALAEEDLNNNYLVFCNRENHGIFWFNSKKFQKVLCPIDATFRPIRILWEQFILPFQIWTGKIDVLLSLGYVCPLFLPCKSVVVIYDLNWFFHPEEFSFFSRLVWKTLVTLSAKRADRIITSSENSKGDIAKILKINPQKISVVYGAVDRTRFKQVKDKKEILVVKAKYGIQEGFILTVSAAYKFKNLGRLIDAFKIVSETETNVQLLIVGLGGRGKPEIEEKVKKYRLEGKVIIAGWVPDEDLPALYSAAEIYVHPSLYEGFGFPVLEAMACGCSVVSSDAASLPELIGNDAILVDAHDVKEIAKGITKILRNSSLASKLRKGGLRRYQDFSWVKSSKEVLKVLTAD